MRESAISRLSAVAATLALICALSLAVAADRAPASTPHDLTGTWSCCGPGGASAQTWTISTMDKASGAFTGTGLGGSIKMTITGTASGDSVTLTTAYDGSSYSATFKGTLTADSKSMAGSWESTSSQKGTWTATRPTAPTPGDPSNPSDPANPGNSSDPNSPGGEKAKAIAGDLYVSDSAANAGRGAVYKINPANGQSTLVHHGAPFAGIRGIALGPEGNLFVADVGAIHKIDMKTSAVTTITPPLSPFLRQPWGIVYEPQLGEFLVTDNYFGTVVRVDPQSGAVKPLASGGGLETPRGIALAPGGPAYVTDYKSHGVIQVERAGSAWKASPFKKTPLFGPEGIAIGTTSAGYRFYVADTIAPGGAGGVTPGGAGGIFSWLGSATPELLVANGGVLAQPVGLASSSDGKTLYIGSTTGIAGTGSVVAMNLVDRKMRILAGGFASPIAFAVAPPKSVPVEVGSGKTPTTANPAGVTTTVTSPTQAVVARVGVSLTIPGDKFAARASKAIPIKPIPPGKPTKVKVPFKPSLTKKIKAAQKAGAKVKAKITVKVTAASGASKTVVKRIRVAG